MYNIITNKRIFFYQMTYAIFNVSWKLIDLLYVILNLFSLKSSLHKKHIHAHVCRRSLVLITNLQKTYYY